MVIDQRRVSIAVFISTITHVNRVPLGNTRGRNDRIPKHMLVQRIDRYGVVYFFLTVFRSVSAGLRYLEDVLSEVLKESKTTGIETLS